MPDFSFLLTLLKKHEKEQDETRDEWPLSSSLSFSCSFRRVSKKKEKAGSANGGEAVVRDLSQKTVVEVRNLEVQTKIRIRKVFGSIQTAAIRLLKDAAMPVSGWQ